GVLRPSDGSDTWSVSEYTIGSSPSVKHFIFASCLTVSSGYWDWCFGKGLRTVLGYRESVSNAECWHMAKNLPARIAYKSIEDSAGHIKAWLSCNDYSYTTDYKATAMGYNSYGSLKFWNWLDRDAARNGECLFRSGNLDVCVPESKFSGMIERSMPVLYGISDQRSVAPAGELKIDFAGLDLRQASALAYETIERSGGLPGDYTALTVRELRMEDINGDAAETVCYSFLWERNYLGTPVSGYRGDIARVTVSGDGDVQHCEVIRRNLSADGSSRESIMTAAEAISLASAEIGNEIRGTDRLAVTDIDLVYYSPDEAATSIRYIPAYRLTISGSWFIFIDAANGRLIR
ncbi:MAG: hypothetical protein PHQ23_16385, partial [Candidatus Wallbacteria bacterium]|nr:hypothetical protein [Candidatus Wallbacteria bacterium]